MKPTLIGLTVTLLLSSGDLIAAPVTNDASITNLHNQCIIRFADTLSAASVKNKADYLVKKAKNQGKSNAKPLHVYQHTIKGMTINLPCQAAANVFKGEDILSMRPDALITMSPKGGNGKPGGGGGGGQETPWSVTRVGGPVDGTGYTAWVLDSGVDYDHPDLNVDTSREFTAFNRGSADDDNGHGTHVAGTIAAIDNNSDVVGVAAGATIVPVKVLDRRGSGSLSGVIAGIDYVGNNAASGDCANMSLGGGISPDLDDAVVAASQRSGAYFVLAAGNDGDDANNHSPARANGPRIATISASDSSDRLASWSNYGNPPVDYAAPGVSILSTKKGGGTTTMSGTSMAAPAACAVMMLRGGNPSTDGTVSGDPDGNPDKIIHL